MSTVLRARCGGCHGGAAPAGGYDTTTYLAVLGNGSDGTPNAIAGDTQSLLLSTIDPLTASPDHVGFDDVFALAREWVVDCRLSDYRPSVHPVGILDPASDEFHGSFVRSVGYDFDLCRRCHSAPELPDFSGSPAGVPGGVPGCLGCHADGPTACNVCHGSAANPAPPRSAEGFLSTTDLGVGAHQTHVAGPSFTNALDCSECHVTPATYDAVGHILLADGSVDDFPAEVTFGARAATTIDPAARLGPPTWDRTGATCTNIYCHGDVLADTNASNTRPRWTVVDGTQAACGTCHGLPPSNHASARCELCHARVIDASGTIVDRNLHLNGQVDLGDGSGTCSACHGGASGPAPPPDLSGQTSPTARGVGAHTSHLAATHRLRGPVPCTDCHLVPAGVASAGHLDTDLPAEVFPADPAFMSLALADGAVPVWDPATLSCTGVYCHGGGLWLSTDTASGLYRTPIWTSPGQAACGFCHGLPPLGTPGAHSAALTIFDCVSCHSLTVDAFGSIVITGAPGSETSTHINGVVDVF